jgi:DNA-binding transcriptional ArsR family regulator
LNATNWLRVAISDPIGNTEAVKKAHNSGREAALGGSPGAKRPSLNALRALEATVRLSSMSAAAEELSVTHGAVSRHIKSLEEMFGIPLLLRGARSVHATAEGGRLAAELSRAFDLITSSVEQIQPGPLTLSPALRPS